MPTNQKIILENDIILSKTEKFPTVDIGGLKTTDNIANKTVKDIMNQILFPYVPFTLGTINASAKHYTITNNQSSMSSNKGVSVSTISINKNNISCKITPGSIPTSSLNVRMWISTSSNTPSENDPKAKEILTAIDSDNYIRNNENISIEFEDTYLTNLSNNPSADILKSSTFKINNKSISTSSTSIRYAPIHIIIIVNDNAGTEVKKYITLYMNDGIIWGVALDSELSKDGFTSWKPTISWESSLNYAASAQTLELSFSKTSSNPYSFFVGIPSTYPYKDKDSRDKDIANINSIKLNPGESLEETWTKVSFTDTSVSNLPAGMKNISKPINGNSSNNIGRPYYIFKNSGGLIGETSITKRFNFSTSVV